VAENDHPRLTWHISLTTVYALTWYTAVLYQINEKKLVSLKHGVRAINQT